MTRKHDTEIPLQYASPRPRAPYPPLLMEVGCRSSVVGAILLGLAVPVGALRYGFVYDGAPSLVGAAIIMVLGGLIGAVLGAILVPAIVLGGYWIIWHLAGRP